VAAGKTIFGFDVAGGCLSNKSVKVFFHLNGNFKKFQFLKVPR
jgi:hypothetical protein